MPLWGKSGASEPGARERTGHLRAVGATGVARAPCLARVLVLSEDKARSRELSRLMRRQGYATFAGDFSVASRKLARDEHPDLALIDGVGGTDAACKLAQSLKEADSAHFPVVVLGDNPTATCRKRAFAGGVDDLIAEPVSETILLSRLRPLVRLAIMNGELQQRAATAQALRLKVPAPAPRPGSESRRVLVAAHGAENVTAVGSALGSEYEIATAPDVFTAASKLHENPYDALVVVIEGNGDDALYLCSQIRNNTRLYNLPVLLVADRGAFESLDDPYRSGASAVLLRPLDDTELRTGIDTLVRRQKLRMAVRDQLCAIQSVAGHNELGGVFKRDFAMAHLERLVRGAASWRRHISLVSFQIQNLGWLARDHGTDAADDLLRQVAEWITALVRSEDMVARLGEKEFGVILPDTAIEDAEIVAQRISGVLLNTQFGVKGADVPILAWIQSGCADFRPVDTAASMLQRAHKNLR